MRFQGSAAEPSEGQKRKLGSGRDVLVSCSRHVIRAKTPFATWASPETPAKSTLPALQDIRTAEAAA
jgi:hypothetical protein